MTKTTQNQFIEWGIWMMLFGLFWAQTSSFSKPIAEFRFGADGWPKVVLISLAFGATAQLLLNLLTPIPDQVKTQPPQTVATPRLINRWQQIGIFTLPLIYLWLMYRTGFFFITPIFIFAYLWVLEVRSWVHLIGISLGVYAFILFIFVRLFYVAMPVGAWPIFYDFNNWLITIVRIGT